MLAGLDTNVLIDVRLLKIEPLLARVLEGEGWTTVFVDREFGDPLGETEGGVARVFPFLEIDPVDARLLPRSSATRSPSWGARERRPAVPPAKRA